MTRGFRRRQRKPTYWMNGASFSLDNFLGTVVEDDAGAPFCQTVVIPLVDDEDLADYNEGFHIRRIVGDLVPVFVQNTENLDLMPEVPVDLRASIQMLKVYEGSDPVSGVELLTQLHAHPFSEAELGDEDIMWTARWLQPSWDELASGSLGPLRFAQTLQGFASWTDTLAGAGITPITAIFNMGSAFPEAFSRPNRFRDLEWKGNRKVQRDHRPFLCFDWTDMDGNVTTTAGGATVLAISGYLRMLVTEAR